MEMVRTFVAGALASFAVAASPASNCAGTSTGRVPLPALGTGMYLGQFQGGLYPNGLNFMPPGHAAAGIARAQSIIARNVAGAPDPDGAYVLLSIGMSNTTQEFCSGGGGAESCTPWSLMGQAADDPAVESTQLVLANGAAGGQTAATWDSPTDANYNRIRDDVLAPQGLSEAQVAAVWVKVANAAPTSSLPDADSDAFALLAQLGDIVRAIDARYPNVRQVFLSSRIYAGYASTPLNPEPYAYESGFAVKWLIEAQITQAATGEIDPIAGNLNFETVAPWLAWGPYIWADGTTPSASGLLYECEDFAADGTHPSMSGQEKVADRLMTFLLTSPFTMPWFRADGGPNPADLSGDGNVGGDDLGLLLNSWGPCDECAADYNGDGTVNGGDLGYLLLHWD